MPGKSQNTDASAGQSPEIVPTEGDVMVTAIGTKYVIGRLKADRETQEHVAWHRHRREALRQACDLAGLNHRVFLCARMSNTTYLPFNCAEVSN